MSSSELHDAVKKISKLNPRPGEGYADNFQVIIPDLSCKRRWGRLVNYYK
jgi:DNA-directed RNA polymerase specialized sigma54-like protein